MYVLAAKFYITIVVAADKTLFLDSYMIVLTWGTENQQAAKKIADCT